MRTAEMALAALAICAPAAARANGAFPAPQGVLVPADLPQEIMLVTNFGVVLSEDGGATWTWSCEQDANALGVLYQRGPAPRRRVFAVANQNVVYSDDATCSWQIAGGLLAGQSVTDVFPDPTNADRVFAVGAAGASYGVFGSTDGGASFGATLYQAASGDVVTSVESARADPQVVYLALMSADGSPKLVRTGDGGGQWTVHDLSASVGSGLLHIIAVDPTDANTVLLRWSSAAGGEAIVVTRDGGATATATLSIPHYFTSFARMPDGALVLGALASVGAVEKSALFVSHDGGATFTENDAVPTVFALAGRGGTLYAATDNFADGYALGASTDEGATWQPVVRFDQIGSIMACVRDNAQCEASCEALAGKGLGSPGKIWDEAVCAGRGGSSGGAGAGTGGQGGVAGAGGGAPGTGGASGGGPSDASGCGCAIKPEPAPPHGRAVFLACVLVWIARARRRTPTNTTRVSMRG